MFTGHNAQVGHQVARRRESTNVSEFGGQNHGREAGHTTEGTEDLDGVAEPIALGRTYDVAFDGSHLAFEVVDLVNPDTKYRLVGSFKLNLAQPQPERLTPILALAEHVPPRFEQPRRPMLDLGKIFRQRLPAAHQSSHPLKLRVRHLYLLQQLVGVHGGQLLGIPPIGLDAITRPTGNGRRRDDSAWNAERSKLSINDITAGRGFVTAFRGKTSRLEVTDEPTKTRRIVLELPRFFDLGRGSVIHACHDRILVDVKTDHHGPGRQRSHSGPLLKIG